MAKGRRYETLLKINAYSGRMYTIIIVRDEWLMAKKSRKQIYLAGESGCLQAGAGVRVDERRRYFLIGWSDIV